MASSPTPFTAGRLAHDAIEKSFKAEDYVVDPDNGAQVAAVRKFYTEVMLLSNMGSLGSFTAPEEAEGYGEAPLSQTRTVVSRYV